MNTRTLIVGNLGYIGPVLVDYLRKHRPESRLIGYDTGFFAGCLIDPLETTDRCVDAQVYKDVRDVDEEDLRGVDHVVYLAAISNDPMGNLYEKPTRDINATAALRFAALARQCGARRFVFASSCSVYGAGGDQAKKEDSALNPLTAYAKSKIEAEQELKALAHEDFFITCLRFATACGASPRLRLDLVLNDFVASSLLRNEIEILSDGTPWRPLIDVQDMCRAILWAMGRSDLKAGTFLAVNVGHDDWNYTIKDLAHAVRDVVGNTRVSINPSAAPDKRSYRVDFALYNALAGQGHKHKSIETTIHELVRNVEDSGFRKLDFRNSHLVRLNTLEHLRRRNKLDADLRWVHPDKAP